MAICLYNKAIHEPFPDLLASAKNERLLEENTVTAELHMSRQAVVGETYGALQRGMRTTSLLIGVDDCVRFGYSYIVALLYDAQKYQGLYRDRSIPS